MELGCQLRAQAAFSSGKKGRCPMIMLWIGDYGTITSNKPYSCTAVQRNWFSWLQLEKLLPKCSQLTVPTAKSLDLRCCLRALQPLCLKQPEPTPGFLNNETNSSAAAMFHTQVFTLRAEPQESPVHCRLPFIYNMVPKNCEPHPKPQSVIHSYQLKASPCLAGVPFLRIAT